MNPKVRLAIASLTLVCTCGPALAASGEVQEADAARKKPLQRCDQLKADAELECLKKARERIVEARNKREASAKGSESKLNEKTVEKDTTPRKGKP